MKKMLFALAVLLGFSIGNTNKVIATDQPKFFNFTESLANKSIVFSPCCGLGYGVSYVSLLPFWKITQLVDGYESFGPHIYGRNLILSYLAVVFPSIYKEKDGISYTCRGGFLDFSHVRNAVDQTALYAYYLFKAREYQKEIRSEHSDYGSVQVTFYPHSLDDEAILQLAMKVYFETAMWHEISSWYDDRPGLTRPMVQTESSFSMEDFYSDLLGAHIAREALKMDHHSFEEAVAITLDKVIRTELGATGLDDTILALDQVEGLWWNKNAIYRTKKLRNFQYKSPLNPALVNHGHLLGCSINDRPISLEIPLQNNNKKIFKDAYSLEIFPHPYFFPIREYFQDNRTKITAEDLPNIIDTLEGKYLEYIAK